MRGFLISYIISCGKSADTVSDNAPTPETVKSQKCVFIFAEQTESKLRLGCPRRVKFRGQNLICGYGGIGRRARFRFLWRQLCTGSSPATRTTSEQSKLCSVFLCMKNIRLLTADVFIPFRERLYFIRRNIAIRNDNIIFL